MRDLPGSLLVEIFARIEVRNRRAPPPTGGCSLVVVEAASAAPEAAWPGGRACCAAVSRAWRAAALHPSLWRDADIILPFYAQDQLWATARFWRQHGCHVHSLCLNVNCDSAQPPPTGESLGFFLALFGALRSLETQGLTAFLSLESLAVCPQLERLEIVEYNGDGAVLPTHNLRGLSLLRRLRHLIFETDVGREADWLGDLQADLLEPLAALSCLTHLHLAPYCKGPELGLSGRVPALPAGPAALGSLRDLALGVNVCLPDASVHVPLPQLTALTLCMSSPRPQWSAVVNRLPCLRVLTLWNFAGPEGLADMRLATTSLTELRIGGSVWRDTPAEGGVPLHTQQLPSLRSLILQDRVFSLLDCFPETHVGRLASLDLVGVEDITEGGLGLLNAVAGHDYLTSLSVSGPGGFVPSCMAEASVPITALPNSQAPYLRGLVSLRLTDMKLVCVPPEVAAATRLTELALVRCWALQLTPPAVSILGSLPALRRLVLCKRGYLSHPKPVEWDAQDLQALQQLTRLREPGRAEEPLLKRECGLRLCSICYTQVLYDYASSRQPSERVDVWGKA